ncbi:hypothetical protein ACIBF6_37980 [Streptosporangium amethystogenes]|uniref:hypothetical protein n=1 Tax=Streptosporangium amethystogenes TaxID=2002 RepID=UPI0037AEE24A
MIGSSLYTVVVFFIGLGPIVLVFAVLFAVAVLYFVGYVAPHGSPMTVTGDGRVFWAGTVLILGAIGWIVGAVALSKTGLAVDVNSLWSSLLSALPFALAAAFCVGGWTSIVSMTLAMALIVTACS